MTWRGEPYAPRHAGRRDRARHRLHPPGAQPLHQPVDRRERLHRRLSAPPRPDRPPARSPRRTRALLGASTSTIAPDTIVGELAPGERQLVEIAKALHRDADLIIFDEPTTSLTPRETARLFDVIARLKAEGRTVIYITHILGDVREALRPDRRPPRRPPRRPRPRRRASRSPRMIRSMIGRELSGLFPDRTAPAAAEVVFRAEALSQPGVLENVSLRGPRRRDPRALRPDGLRPQRARPRRLRPRPARARQPSPSPAAPLAGTPAERIAAGIAFVTENRREEGLMMEAPVADNLSLVAVRDFGRGAAGAPRPRGARRGDRAGQGRARHPRRRHRHASRSRRSPAATSRRS